MSQSQQTFESQEAKQQAWQDILNDWQKSQLPVSQYCQRHGIAKSTFKRWQALLRPETKKLRFAEVVVKPKAALASIAPIKLTTPSGYGLRLSALDEVSVRSIILLLKGLS